MHCHCAIPFLFKGVHEILTKIAAVTSQVLSCCKSLKLTEQYQFLQATQK